MSSDAKRDRGCGESVCFEGDCGFAGVLDLCCGGEDGGSGGGGGGGDGGSGGGGDGGSGGRCGGGGGGGGVYGGWAVLHSTDTAFFLQVPLKMS